MRTCNYDYEICLNFSVIQSGLSYSLTSSVLFCLNSEKLSVECTEAPSIIGDVVIPNRSFSLAKIPVQCTEKSSSTFGLMPYRIFPYLEWRPLQCSEMSFSREYLTLSYSAQRSVLCAEIFSPSKGYFISFSGGSVYSDKFPAQCTEMSLPRRVFPWLGGQSPYLNECKKNSSPKFDDLLSLRKRSSYSNNLLVQCTEIPSSKEASTSFSDRSSKLVNPPVECTEICSLKDNSSWLSSRPPQLDKLPIQCSPCTLR